MDEIASEPSLDSRLNTPKDMVDYFGSKLRTTDDCQCRPPIHSLKEALAQLPHLHSSMVAACDWLINVSQVTTEEVDPQHNPRNLCHDYWKGAFRGEYRVGTKQWDFFCPCWHGGQAVKALCLAYEVSRDERCLESARMAGEFLLSCQVQEGVDSGLLLAYEDFSDKVNSSAVLESLDGLFHLADATGDTRYEQAAIAALRWVRDHTWVKGEGMIIACYDPVAHQTIEPAFVLERGGAGRPLADDAVFLKGYQRSTDQSLREVFYDIMNRLLIEERPQGNWVGYGPCNHETGEIHPRQAYWWGKPMMDAYRDSGEQRWLDAACRSATWYTKAQRRDGGLFRMTDLNFNTGCFNHATSGIVCAAIFWVELFELTGQTKWLEPVRKAMDYAMSMQFVEPKDPNLTGCILEKIIAPDGTDRSPYHIRDLGTTFFVQAAAKLILAGQG
ncbi:MAG: hypothetical protein CMJ20_07755 [Phycisphaeraceae bacterium]|nr:hypothetical protein [Phycisphaeraceae bacterium]